MRYFLAGWLLLTIIAVSILGFRGTTSRRPPLEIFPDMDRQPKLRPQEPNRFFANGRSSQLPVAGTVARSVPYQLAASDPNSLVYPYEDAPVNTGYIPGTTNFVASIPFEVTQQFMARGRERFEIYCAPCHGAAGDGKGITTRFGMAIIRNLHEPRVVEMPDGELFQVISNGRGQMGPYASQIDTRDRWAIVAYVRALQLSQLGTPTDLPEHIRGTLKK